MFDIPLFASHYAPNRAQKDSGPEFIASAIRRYLAAARVETLYIEPGSPWENGYATSFHSRLLDELLNAELFEGLRAAKALAAKWKNEYNHRRPHSSLAVLPDPGGLRGLLRGRSSSVAWRACAPPCVWPSGKDNPNPRLS